MQGEPKGSPFFYAFFRVREGDRGEHTRKGTHTRMPIEPMRVNIPNWWLLSDVYDFIEDIYRSVISINFHKFLTGWKYRAACAWIEP
jgi:hypothetical protein